MDELKHNSKPDPADASGSVTLLLREIRQGHQDAYRKLLEIVVDELKARACRLMEQERAEHTLQPTALINEACLRLLEPNAISNAENRRYLLRAANEAMRRVLIDHARARNTQKRGGGIERVAFDDVLDNFEAVQGVDFTELNDALDRLRLTSSRQHEVVMHRFFGGKTVEQTAELLGVPVKTVEIDWRIARSKLRKELRGE